MPIWYDNAMLDDCTKLRFPSSGTSEVPLIFAPQVLRCHAAGPGGRALLALLDTGTDPSVIDLALARRLGLRLGDFALGHDAASDSVPFTETVLPWLRIGDLIVRDLYMLAVDLSAAPFAIDVVLGYNVLAQLLVTIDYASGRLALRHPELGLPATASAAVELPLVFCEHYPALSGLSLGSDLAIELAAIDTGSNAGLTLTLDRALRAGLHQGERALGAATGYGFASDCTVLRSEVPTLRLGPFTLQNVEIATLCGDGGELRRPGRATIGNRLLARFTRVSLDYQRAVCVIEAAQGGPTTAAEMAMMEICNRKSALEPPLPGSSLSMIRLFLLLLLLLPASALDLAPAPLNPPPLSLGACQTPQTTTDALLTQLAGSDYACTEALAHALNAQADDAVMTELFVMAKSGRHALTRRNALRTLGRLADSPRGSRAYELLHRRYAAATRSLATATLRREHDNFLLQDAIWLLDRFYFPSLSVLPDLMRVSADSLAAPALRARALYAPPGRLIAVQQTALAPAEYTFLVAGLASDAIAVRAEAAAAIARLPEVRLNPTTRRALQLVLARAWQAAPPLRIAEDDGGKPVLPLRYEEPDATALYAQAALARALDRFAPGRQRLRELQAAYEQLALPQQQRVAAFAADVQAEHSRSTILVRSNAATDLDKLGDVLQSAELMFQQVTAATFTPIPGEVRPLTVMILPHRAAYQEYLRAFTPFAFTNDGIFDELSATLYTYRRSSMQSTNTLEQTLRHEFAHYLAAQRIFPGHWRSPGYHDQPKGWIDEGLAEVIADVSHLDTICTARQLRPLSELLAMRTGYDRFGTFDYAYAWALSTFLNQERSAVLQRVLAAYRDGSYRIERFAEITGVAVEELERDWHAAMREWCAAGRL
ncbi:hypothetical protein HC891_07785 [Candidatus Gracilibacteria bacterium]|nr:hypothetical protein [Candidatus Gracilibacteria bacterium]